MTALVHPKVPSDVGRGTAEAPQAPPATITKPLAAPDITPSATIDCSNAATELAAAQKRIAELMAQLDQMSAPVVNNPDTSADDDARPPNGASQDGGPPEQDVRQMQEANLAIAVAIALFLMAAYVAINSMKRRRYAVDHAASSASPDGERSIDLAPTLLPATEKVLQESAQGPRTFPAQISRRVLPSLIDTAVTLLIGAVIVIAVALISKIFGV